MTTHFSCPLYFSPCPCPCYPLTQFLTGQINLRRVLQPLLPLLSPA